MRQQHLPLSPHPSHLHFPPATISPCADCPLPSPVFKYIGSPRSYSYLAKVLLPIYDKLWYTLPFLVTSLHVFISPYTKVEETPALHAVHDILAHGISSNALQHYDHIVYPGPVARSMIPNLLLAAFTYPLSLVMGVRQGLPLQVLIRLVQTVFFSAGLAHLSSSISRYYRSQLTSRLFLILSTTQFHIPYYAGRTLPNFMALPFALFGISLIIRPSKHSSKPRLGLTIISLTGTIARMEIAPISLALALTLIWQRRLSVFQALSGGVYGGIIGIAMTSIIDVKFLSPNSYACDWWPELSSALFNIMHGKSKDWGVMPWWYYLSALSKLCLASIPLALLGCCISLRQNERDREMLKVRCVSLTVFPLMKGQASC